MNLELDSSTASQPVNSGAGNEVPSVEEVVQEKGGWDENGTLMDEMLPNSIPDTGMGYGVGSDMLNSNDGVKPLDSPQVSI